MKIKIDHPKTLGIVTSFVLLFSILVILLVIDLLFLVSHHK